MFDKLKFWGKKPPYEQDEEKCAESGENSQEKCAEPCEEKKMANVNIKDCEMRGLRTYVDKIDDYHSVALTFFCDAIYRDEIKKYIPSGKIDIYQPYLDIKTYKNQRTKYFFEQVVPFMILDSPREGEIEVHCTFNRVTKTCI